MTEGWVDKIVVLSQAERKGQRVKFLCCTTTSHFLGPLIPFFILLKYSSTEHKGDEPTSLRRGEGYLEAGGD